METWVRGAAMFNRSLEVGIHWRDDACRYYTQIVQEVVE